MPEIPTQLLALWLAIAFDLLLGEPRSALHPVAWLGQAIAAFQRHAPKQGRCVPFLAGALFMLLGVVAAAALGFYLHAAFSRLPTPLFVLAEAAALKLTFSIRSLAAAGKSVQSALDRGDLLEARRLLGWHLVSRDTSRLNESQVAAGTIESLSENASDSIVAPLLCYLCGGLPAAFAYRFINTCDAMLGYHDPQREWLGKPVARFDDLINLLPARLTAGLIVAAGFIRGSSPMRGARIWLRDHHLTASPNAGHPMSAAAGVLGVQLEKVGHYRLGSGQRQPEPCDIALARRMLWRVAGLTVVALSVIFLLIR